MSMILNNIKSFRRKNSITQEELAEKLSVTRQAVSNWENGKTEPDIETLTKIAQIFDISIDELVGGIPAGVTELWGKKIHLRLGIIFTAFYILSTLFMIAIEPSLIDYQRLNYDTVPGAFFLLIWKPLTVFFGGIGVSSFIFYSIGFYIRNKYLRMALVTFGVILLTATMGYFLYIFFGTSVFSIPELPLFLPSWYYVFIHEHSMVHAVSAAFIFFGLAKR